MEQLLNMLNLANNFIENEEYDQALHVLENSALSSSTKSDRQLWNALTQFYRAQAYDGKGDGSKAVETIRLAVDELQRHVENVDERIEQNAEVLLYIYFEAASIEYKWGDQVKALRWTERMYQLYNDSGLKHSRGTDLCYGPMMGDMAGLAFNLGLLGLARLYLQEALEIFAKQGQSRDLAKAVLNLAVFENRIGNRDLAVDLLNKLITLNPETEISPEALFLLATMSYKDGNIKQCQSILDKIQQKTKSDEIEDLDIVVSITLLRAKVLRRTGHKDQAIKLLRELVNQLVNKDYRGTWLALGQLELAYYLGEKGNFLEAVEFAQAARELASKRGFRELRARAAAFLGGIKYISGDYEGAFKILTEATDSYDIGESIIGLGYQEMMKTAVPFSDHLILLPLSAVACGRLEDAVIALEYTRHVADREVRRIRAFLQEGNFTSEMQAYEEFHFAIDMLNSLFHDHIEIAYDEYQKYLRVLEKGLSARWDKLLYLANEYNIYFDRNHILKTLKNIQPEDSFIYLFSDNDELLIVIVTHRGILTYTTTSNIKHGIKGIIRRLYNEMRDTGFLADQMLLELSKIIWLPISKKLKESNINPRRLNVIPFGWANILPFHLLGTYSKGGYLFEDFDVIYRSTILSSSSAKGTIGTKPTISILFVSPFPNDLPGARLEFDAIVSSGLVVQSLLGQECTRDKLFENLSEATYDVVHFACHAVANYDIPSLSFLELANGQRCFISDLISRGECNGAAVVLSACDTAIAAVNKIDLKNSLADAFRHSNASAVIASQWPTEDESTVMLNRYLYANLASGEPIWASFLHAYRQLLPIMQIEKLNPRYWGSFMLFFA